MSGHQRKKKGRKKERKKLPLQSCGCFTAFDKGALPEEYLSHNCDEQCLEGHWTYLMPFLP